MNAYGYIRISGNGPHFLVPQDEETQGIRITHCATYNDVNITSIYKDEDGGTNRLLDLIDDANEGDMIIVSSVDRLGGSLLCIMEVLDKIQSKKMKISSADASIQAEEFSITTKLKFQMMANILDVISSPEAQDAMNKNKYFEKMEYEKTKKENCELILENLRMNDFISLKCAEVARLQDQVASIKNMG